MRSRVRNVVVRGDVVWKLIVENSVLCLLLAFIFILLLGGLLFHWFLFCFYVMERRNYYGFFTKRSVFYFIFFQLLILFISLLMCFLCIFEEYIILKEVLFDSWICIKFVCNSCSFSLMPIKIQIRNKWEFFHEGLWIYQLNSRYVTCSSCYCKFKMADIMCLCFLFLVLVVI